MTLHQASVLARVSIATLSLFLNRKNNPNARTIYKIRKLIGETQ